MGALDSVAVTPGAGANISTVLMADGKEMQIVREDRATASTRDAWPVVTTAAISRIPADFNRLSLTISNNGSSRVLVRHDGVAPTNTTDGYDVAMDPGALYEVPYRMAPLAVSFLGLAAGGHVVSRMGTSA
jgi:hypothetical protein